MYATVFNGLGILSALFFVGKWPEAESE